VPERTPAGLSHGLFLDVSGDLLDAGRRWPVPGILADFDTTPHRPLHRGSLPPLRGKDRMGGDHATFELAPHPDLPPQGGKGPSNGALEDLFVRGYLSGRATSGASAQRVRSEYARLGVEWSLPSWVSAVGFFHGLLCDDGDSPDVERAFARLAPLLPDADRVVQ
jgi:hypothetical protein